MFPSRMQQEDGYSAYVVVQYLNLWILNVVLFEKKVFAQPVEQLKNDRFKESSPLEVSFI